MESWIQIGMTIWLIAFMVFKANPLNDPTNPKSAMNYYHSDNVAARAELKRNLEEERANGDDPIDVVITGSMCGYSYARRWS